MTDTRTELEAMTVAALAAVCRDLGLAVGGRKDALVGRVLAASVQRYGTTLISIPLPP